MLPTKFRFIWQSGFRGEIFLGIKLTYIKIAHLVAIRKQTWPPQAIFASDWLISKKSSPLKPLCRINRNFIGSILGMTSIKIAHLVGVGHVC
jgi:hypothetical protein